MNAKTLREKNTQQLQEELAILMKRKFDINLNREAGNKKEIRRDIARIKTVISEKQQDK